MYTLVWTTGFARTAGKFLKQHPELREKFAAILAIWSAILFSRTFGITSLAAS